MRTPLLKWMLALPLVVGAPAAARAAEEGDAAAEQPPLLNIDPGMYFWTVLLFLALFAVLAKFVWPHILKGLQDRENKQRTDLEQAEQQRKEAEKTLAEYKQQLADARKEAQQLIEQSRADAQKLADDMKAQTEQEIQQIRQRADREIQAAKEEAVADLYDRTAELATSIAGRILQREISADDQKALVESSLNELASSEQSGAERSMSGQA